MPSRRTTGIALMVALVLAVGGVLVAAASKSSEQVASVGVLPVYPVAPIVQGATACQRPIGITESFDRVRFNVGTFGRSGPPLLVRVLDQESEEELGSGQVRPDWVDDGSAQDVNVGTVPSGHRVAVCITNQGPVRAYVYGDYYNGAYGTGPLGVTPTNTTNSADIDHVGLLGDMSLALLSSSSRSLLERVPAIFEHSAAFRPPIAGTWITWLLAALILVGAPIALWAALVRAGRMGRSEDERRYPDSSRL